jgi:hypothetical protein
METLTKVGMGALLVAAVPVSGDASVWAQWGLAGLVVGYTLYRDWQRERRMSEALDKHHAWVQQTLIGALERNTVAMERIASRPCLREAKE